MNSAVIRNTQNTRLFTLLEGLYKLKLDMFNDELRQIVKDGSFSRTAPDIAVSLLFFARLVEQGKNPLDLEVI